MIDDGGWGGGMRDEISHIGRSGSHLFLQMPGRRISGKRKMSREVGLRWECSEFT